MTITLDGETLQAERSEPVAAALIAAGKGMIARSPKFHRPRAPSCMRAACDGCLARVNDIPNVMTCQVPAQEGTVVVSQNRLGPREADLLRVTDWFFPNGMNHHELFAGVVGVQRVMQAFARRIAGLGKLPLTAAPMRPATRRTPDVVVVGAGAAGMSVARRLADAGRSVEVIDDQLVPGGGIRALAKRDANAFGKTTAQFDGLVARGQVRLRQRTVAGGMYGEDLLVVGPEGAEILTARTLVLACGAHDGALAFEGNDVPGIMSARAAGWLLAGGILVGRNVVIVIPPGGGPFGESFAVALKASTTGIAVEVVFGEPVRALGTSHVRGIVVRDAIGDEHEYTADVVVLDAPRSAAFELAEQAGAKLRASSHGFAVITTRGKIGPNRFAVGEMTGAPLDALAVEAEADTVAQTIAEEKNAGQP